MLSIATETLRNPTFHLDMAANYPEMFPSNYAVGSDRTFYAQDLTSLLLARNKGELDGTSPLITEEHARRLITAASRALLRNAASSEQPLQHLVQNER